MAAAATSFAVRTPRWDLWYDGQNIGGRVSPMLVSITYTDHVGHSSNDLEFELEDREKRWQAGWFPTQGDLVRLAIGYDGEELLSCGDFQVDELELEGPPDVMKMRCIAAYITPALRTHNSRGYENQTLLSIASTIAKKHGMSVVGLPDSINVAFARVTQKHENDLSFLRRIANDHNYDFRVQGTRAGAAMQLVFYSRSAVEAAAPATTIHRTDAMKFYFKSKTHQTYKAAQVSYQNPASKSLVMASVNASPVPASGDTRKLVVRAENAQQATLKAQAALHNHNMLAVTGTITMPGSTAVIAGNNVMLSGFGVFDDVYQVTSAKHKLTRAEGYITEAEVRKLG